MHKDSKAFTLLFAAAVCGVCSIFVAGSAVSLRERQEENKLLDRQTKVLTVAGLISEGQVVEREVVPQLFEANIVPVVIELQSGEILPDVDVTTFDPVIEARETSSSRLAPPNQAQVFRIPNRAMLYHVIEDGEIKSLVLPVEGKGLWSTLYGFLALSADTSTVEGLIFYQHLETPGLGGEVDNPSWRSKWPGQLVYNENWEPVIEVTKNASGVHEIDALSGATITSNGVTYLLHFWLGEHGFGPYLDQYRAERGIQ